MRISSCLLLILCLSACNRGVKNDEAVRQGVMDRLSKVGMNVAAMDVKISAVQFSGNQADATVSINPKGNSGAGMSMKYHLEQQGAKWVVVGHQGAGAGANPHGDGMVAPGAPNPHGQGGMPGAMPATPGRMPSPEDLPPAGKKK